MTHGPLPDDAPVVICKTADDPRPSHPDSTTVRCAGPCGQVLIASPTSRRMLADGAQAWCAACAVASGQSIDGLEYVPGSMEELGAHLGEDEARARREVLAEEVRRHESWGTLARLAYRRWRP